MVFSEDNSSGNPRYELKFGTCITQIDLLDNSTQLVQRLIEESETQIMPFRRCSMEGADPHSPPRAGLPSVLNSEWEQQLPDGGWVPLNPDLCWEIQNLYSEEIRFGSHVLRPRPGLEIDLEKFEVRSSWPDKYCHITGAN